MAKLRKMLGQADDPQIITLMRLIETQSKDTLAAWAAACAKERYLEIYEEAHRVERRRRGQLAAVTPTRHGSLARARRTPLLRRARTIAQGGAAPAAQAAARAVSTACAVVQTPTNALGFVFYGAAAVAYDKAGLTASEEEYHSLAAAEFDTLAASLRAASVPEEAHPVKINWNC